MLSWGRGVEITIYGLVCSIDECIAYSHKFSGNFNTFATHLHTFLAHT
jgi:hypothetical protein